MRDKRRRHAVRRAVPGVPPCRARRGGGRPWIQLSSLPIERRRTGSRRSGPTRTACPGRRAPCGTWRAGPPRRRRAHRRAGRSRQSKGQEGGGRGESSITGRINLPSGPRRSHTLSPRRWEREPRIDCLRLRRQRRELKVAGAAEGKDPGLLISISPGNATAHKQPLPSPSRRPAAHARAAGAKRRSRGKPCYWMLSRGRVGVGRDGRPGTALWSVDQRLEPPKVTERARKRNRNSADAPQ